MLYTTEYTELQRLLSGVHSVMRVKLALAGEGGGCTPIPFITFTITSKVAVYAPAEWETHEPCFISWKNMYSVLYTHDGQERDTAILYYRRGWLSLNSPVNNVESHDGIHMLVQSI